MPRHTISLNQFREDVCNWVHIEELSNPACRLTELLGQKCGRSTVERRLRPDLVMHSLAENFSCW